MINHDSERESRTGIPEVILAEPKLPRELEAAINSALNSNSQVLLTRVQKEQLEHIREIVNTSSFYIKTDAYDRTIIISKQKFEDQISSKYKVGILSAGTSDERYVQEVEMTLLFLGIGFESYKDIGVAGINRHKDVLNKIHNDNAFKCLIVLAGQDGAIFPVISAQSTLPMIAVPTPIGYGYGGKGEAALQSALQSCSPGVVVVNIENGFGAAVFVSKLFNQMS